MQIVLLFRVDEQMVKCNVQCRSKKHLFSRSTFLFIKEGKEVSKNWCVPWSVCKICKAWKFISPRCFYFCFFEGVFLHGVQTDHKLTIFLPLRHKSQCILPS